MMAVFAGIAMGHYFLYSTLGCHLCELAEDLLMPFVTQGSVQVTVIDIAEDNALIAAYGTAIPVLRNSEEPGQGRELRWPFTTPELTHFFSSVV